MPNNWKKYKLGEIAGFSYGKMPKKELLAKGIYPTYSGYKYQYKYPQFNCDKNDIIIVARGVGGTGDVKIVKEKCYLTNLSIKIELDKNIVDFQYFYFQYFLNTLRYLDSGSAQSQITINDLNRLELKLPPLQEQQSIASILSAIDDKIENNLAINKTLEEMAMALYKHWFVDFGPFQDGEFVESELGMIPEGWEVKKITELIEVKDGTHDSPKRVDKGCFLITSKHMIGNIIDFSTAYKISQDDFTKINKRSLVEKGDILMTMIGTVGNFHFVNEEPNYVIKNIGLFKTSKLPKIQSYLYSYFKSKIGQEYIKAQMTGSTQQYVTLNTLRNFDIIVPNEETLNEFNQITNDYFETIMNRTKENQTLTQLRDTLLPQLISGAVRLKEFREY